MPPSFLASAGVGDPLSSQCATDYFTAMLQAGVPNTEMHIYGSGGHGGTSRRCASVEDCAVPTTYLGSPMDWTKPHPRLHAALQSGLW